ncbi:hypothetical protein [Hyphomicrobium sp. LHD-15]|uniref:hypothetical protein n=1 Tax=Hyphomicrobium sp. LHD-15 TaxID=3072142 RepID=UPI0028108E49|nr:hypothetical protein [Hyphomicrobium sp. LHD-15]MDQ8700152.1 hypothetical protein [Hyphomicrobium sp. LHD-15]
MRRKQSSLALVALAVAGCSADGPSPILSLPTAAELNTQNAQSENNTTSALSAILMPKELVVGTPTEVYTRIARGVLTCWFGAAGPLKAEYIYHADAEPASKGGNSEIKILTRDAEAADPRSVRAYRIAIAPSEGKTKVEIENVRLPEPLATRLKQDVERWSGDEEGCGKTPVTAGWAAEQVVDTKATKKNKEKTK